MKNIKFNSRSLAGLFLVVMCLTAAAGSAVAQGVFTFTSNSSIAINDLAVANPYPSSINVSNVPLGVSRVTVKLKGFSHSYPDDAGVILVSPTGQKVYIFTDCLGDGGGDGVSNLDLTFDEYAAATLPDNPLSDTPSGTYKPKKGTSDGLSPEHAASFAAPAPSGPYAETLTVLNNQDPNGTWQLFVDDDGMGDTGVIQNGWELTIHTAQPTASDAVLGGRVTGFTGGGIRGAMLTMTDTNNVSTTVTTNSFGYYTFPAKPVGAAYTITITAKGYTFNPNTQTVMLNQDETLNWTMTP